MPGRNQYPTGADLLAFLETAGFSSTLATDTAFLGGDLELYAVAGWRAFNREADRQMLAVSGTRSFDRAGINGVLVLGDDLASGTTPSVTDQSATLTVGTEVRFEPLDAVGRGEPYNRARFLRRWGYNYASPYSIAPLVTITGAWGYATLIPEDAWLGMLALGALALFPLIQQARSSGLDSWQEADMIERYGSDPLAGLRVGWQNLALMTAGGMGADGKRRYGTYTRLPLAGSVR